jgi:CRP-like cAMP-binding protein
MLLVVVQLVQVEFVPAGKILLREGSTPDQLVVVRQGAVQVSGGALPGGQDPSKE